jgi:hypothetical protein
MSRKSFMEGPWTELSRNEDEAKAIDVMRGHWQPPSRAALYSQYRSLSNGRESAPVVCWTIHKAQGFIPGNFTDAGLSIGCNKDMYSINCQHPMRRLQYRCAEQRGTAAATCWLETRRTSCMCTNESGAQCHCEGLGLCVSQALLESSSLCRSC